MNFGTLITYLDHQSEVAFLEGDTIETLAKLKAKQHNNPFVQEILSNILDNCQIESVESILTRTDVAQALAKTRLKYMADDAPVEGFRLVEKTILWIDDAFNEEAWQDK